jgi:hypothetical protein
MRTERGLVKVLDSAQQVREPTARRPVTQPQVTIAGMVVGTVSYGARAALGRPVTGPISLGIVLSSWRPAGFLRYASPTKSSTTSCEIPPARILRRRCRRFDAVVARALEVADLPLPVRTRHAPDPARWLARTDTVPRGATAASPPACRRRQYRAIGGGMTFANITREPADDWIAQITGAVSSSKNIHG